ncbi:MAG: polyphosphate kinase 1 [Bacteroidales bacterium]
MDLSKDYSLQNREQSWLSFNARVLQEAADPNNPLMERIKFLGIFSNNQDEFFKVRVATLRRIQKLSRSKTAIHHETAELIRKIAEVTLQQQNTFTEIYRKILKELSTHNIHILNEKRLNEEQKTFTRNYFKTEIRPLIFPIMLKRLNKQTSLRDRSIYLAIEMWDSHQNLQPEQALIKIPGTISRFIILPSRNGETNILLIDDAVRLCLHEIFSFMGYDVYRAYTIKFTRDAELDIDNDISKSFLELMEESLKQRKKGSTLRLVYDKNIPEELLKTVIKKMQLSKSDVMIKGGRYHNFKDFMDFPEVGASALFCPPMPPVHHPDLPYGRSVLGAVRDKDILIHFPYQSFHHIIDLLREASIDPYVRSIKMTIYRAAPNSKVINALINAARNGKAVTVYMELQARFDEKANIYWAERLQEEGVKIIRTIPGFKVHAKLILIKRREGRKEMVYSNISTGNFNELTSKVYSDTSLLTTDKKIGHEVSQVFDLFEANYQQYRFKKLFVSPFNTRSGIISLLNQEVKNAKTGKEAWVIIKVNNIVDEALARKIYDSAKSGVKVKLIIRGSCILQPKTEEERQNIEIISILDHYLEHSRIFVFCNDQKPLFYLSSADLMTRNLDHRIEVTVPVQDPLLQQELMDYLNIQLRDNVKARYLDYHRMNQYKTTSDPPCRSQAEHYAYFKSKSI